MNFPGFFCCWIRAYFEGLACSDLYGHLIKNSYLCWWQQYLRSYLSGVAWSTMGQITEIVLWWTDSCLWAHGFTWYFHGDCIGSWICRSDFILGIGLHSYAFFGAAWCRCTFTIATFVDACGAFTTGGRNFFTGLLFRTLLGLGNLLHRCPVN